MEFSAEVLQDIYKDVQNPEKTISVSYIQNSISPDALVCVFGILSTQRGLQIKKEMLSWLSKQFNVYCVEQQEPGKLFEYPALRFAQWLSTTQSLPYILYVHTKGAACVRDTQNSVRQMWKHEFGTQSIFNNYIRELSTGKFDVICPLLGPHKETWFNGMIISQRVFSTIPVIRPSENRYDFQHLFNNPSLYLKGMLRNNIDGLQLNSFMVTHAFVKNKIRSASDYTVASVFYQKAN